MPASCRSFSRAEYNHAIYDKFVVGWTNLGGFFKVCAEEQQYLFIQADAVAFRANRHFQAMGITVAVSGYLPGIQVACLRVTGDIIIGAVLIGPAINAGNPIQVWQTVDNTVGIYCLAGSFMVNAIDDDKVFGTVREGETSIPAAVIRSCPGINLYGREVGSDAMGFPITGPLYSRTA